jgi:hypothetical protein
MIISDLSILEVVQANDVLGGFDVVLGTTTGNITSTEQAAINSALTLTSTIYQTVITKVKGISANAEGNALASGPNASATVVSSTLTQPGLAAASSTSTSLTSSYYH